MARKRFLFFHSIQSFLAKFFLRRKKWIYRIILTALTGILTASGQIWVGFTLEKVANAQDATIFSSSTSVQNLVEQGRRYYEAGNFQEAERVLLQAASALTNQGDRVIQAMIYSNLSLVYQQMGNWENAEKYINQSLELLQSGETAANSTNRLKVLAQSLDVLARLQMERGEAEKALNSWQQATDIYSKLEDENRKIRSQLNQAEALQALGLYPRCKELLLSVNITLQKQQNSRLKADAMRSLGDVLRVVGETENTETLWKQLQKDLGLKDSDSLQQALEILDKSVRIAEGIQPPQDLSAFYLSLGNTARALYQKERDLYERSENPDHIEAALSKWATTALDYYQCSTNTSTYCSKEIQGKLNQLSLLVDIGNWLTKLKPDEYLDIDKWWKKLENQIAELPQTEKKLVEFQPMQPSKINAYINFTQSLIKLKQISADIHEKQKTYPAINYSVWETIDKLNDPIIENLENAAIKAKELNNQRLEAESLGSLGGLYEQLEKWDLAKSKSEDALKIAQSTQAWDIAYWLQWQLGRIYKSRENIEMAVKFYSAAVKSLESVRRDLSVLYLDIQYTFKENVEPVYRELVDLLLQSENPSQNNLMQAISVIQGLQLAELENFLQCSLQQENPVTINYIVDRNDSTEAVIYPIILEKRLKVIVKLPKQEELLYYQTEIDRQEVEKILVNLQKDLPEIDKTNQVNSLSNKVYDWLIRPAKEKFIENQVTTLVFLLDDRLRNIPMGVLYDNDKKEYLVEQFAVSLTTGLQLADPKSLKRGELKAIVAGLTEARQGFPALPNLARQLEKINSEIPSKKLLNQQFTGATLQEEIEQLPFPVIHLATHGQFSSQAKDTFIITWDDHLNVNQLSNLLQRRQQTRPEPIELLTLSACQTATGDRRAALGLSGVAVRAGARSTLGTLWKVSPDDSTTLFSKFYQELKDPKLTRAKALQNAQIDILKNVDNRPSIWAAYVLIGNWL